MTEAIRRYTDGVEIRMAETDGKKVFSGYALVFNRASVPMRIQGRRFVETIAQTALANADMSNVVARYNHQYNSLLARTPNSLQLDVDEKGLAFRFDYDPNDPEHVAMAAKVARGDIRACSFEFRLRENGDVWQRDGDVWKRELTDISEILDVSLVIDPAYPDAEMKDAPTMRSFARASKETEGENGEQARNLANALLCVYGGNN